MIGKPEKNILTGKEMINYLQERNVVVTSPRGCIYPRDLEDLPYMTIKALYDILKQREERERKYIKK